MFKKEINWNLMKKYYDEKHFSYDRFFKKYGLTHSIVESIPDEKVVEVIYDYALFCIGDKSYEDDTLNQLPEPVQAVFLVWLLNGEVHNGGFDQYFFNSSGYFIYETIDFLAKIKACNVQNLTQKALDAVNVIGFDEEQYKALQKSQELEYDEEVSEILENLDNKFYDYPDDLDELLLNYVKEKMDKLH